MLLLFIKECKWMSGNKWKERGTIHIFVINNTLIAALYCLINLVGWFGWKIEFSSLLNTEIAIKATVFICVIVWLV